MFFSLSLVAVLIHVEAVVYSTLYSLCCVVLHGIMFSNIIHYLVSVIHKVEEISDFCDDVLFMTNMFVFVIILVVCVS